MSSFRLSLLSKSEHFSIEFSNQVKKEKWKMKNEIYVLGEESR